ncbi:MAG TPA: hypothetical protein VNS12_00840 [Pelagibacterium sp.]|nr:hypothetical protein [Pelagibacterium sp.]HWJ86600.1 hypothetical protein [Pelagibacterium sp.]
MPNNQTPRDHDDKKRETQTGKSAGGHSQTQKSASGHERTDKDHKR